MSSSNPWIMTAHVSDQPDEDEIRRALSVLINPGELHELRAIPSGRCDLVTTGPDWTEGAVEAALRLSDDRGLYYTINPVQSELAKAAKNVDVTRRRWVLIDIDAVKPEAAKGESSTEAEKEAARFVAAAVLDELSELGWGAPLLIDSGNGFHLLYRVDLPNDARARDAVTKLLRALAKKHNTDGATVDKSVHNAARVAKLPGTWSKKGTSTAERPHRLCRLLSVPSTLEVVTIEQIEAYGGETPAPPKVDPWLMQVQTHGTNGHGPYVARALDDELGRVALAPGGDRNNQLNRSAFALGQFVGAGLLGHDLVADKLAYAAARAGLEEKESQDTIRSGLEAGIAQPRQLPAQTPTNANGNGKANGSLVSSVSTATPVVIRDEDVQLTRLSDVQARAIDWLMPRRIPIRKLTLLAGFPKLGKSFLTADLAARISTGAEIPASNGECFEPGSVILLSAEDDLDDTVKPRLIAAGADTDRIHALETIRLPSGEFSPFRLENVRYLEHAIRRVHDVRLVIIDPITHYVGAKVDDHKVAQLRALLSPLKDLASSAEIAILIITHFNKGTSSNVLSRVIGSSAYTQFVRANWVLLKDPKDPKRRLLLDAGTNLSEDPLGMAFRIIDGRVVWEDEPVCLDPNEVLGDEQTNQREKKRQESPSKLKDCLTWLAQLFPDSLARLRSDEVINRGKEQGFSRDMIFRAKKELPWLRAFKEGTGEWFWRRSDSWQPFKSSGSSDPSDGFHPP